MLLSICFNLTFFLVFAQTENRKQVEERKSQVELADFQKYLGLLIEPLPKNQTRFTFSQIDSRNERPCAFVIDVSEDKYRVLSCEPVIPDLMRLVDDLNTHRDFYRFLKLCRQRFVSLAQK
jgi:hypothetical protein